MNFEELKGIPVFKEVPEDVLTMFASLMKDEEFPAGHSIFEEDSISDKLFIIKTGEVEIRKATRMKHGSAHKVIAVLKRGEFFGEMAVFLNQPRSAAAVAKTDVVLASISRDDLMEVLGRSPEAAFKVMGFFTSALTQRLRETTKELVTVYETGRHIISARNMQELADYLLEAVFGSVDATEAALVVLRNEFNNDFEVVGQRGFEDMQYGTAVSEDDALLSNLCVMKEPIVCHDVPTDERFSVSSDSLWTSSSLLASPFLYREKFLGFVVLVNRTMKSAFSYSHMVLISALSGYVSVAIENLQFIQAEIDRARLEQTKSTIQPFFR